VAWTFDNILLPDSNVNEPESHGYVKFTIELKDSIPQDTKIENFAGIYFDFNDPVITNTTFVTRKDYYPESALKNSSLISATDKYICLNDTAIMTASGAIDYYWIENSTLKQQPYGKAKAYPKTDTKYYIKAASLFGWDYYDSVYVYISKPAPSLDSDQAACAGEEVQLTPGVYPAVDWFYVDTIAYLEGDNMSELAEYRNATEIIVNEAGTYIVKVSDSLGCIAYDTVQVRLLALPDISVSKTTDNTLDALTDAQVQWYLGDSLLSGETGLSLVATAEGDYHALATDPVTGCQTKSDTISIILSAGETEATEILIYPNPTSGHLYINYAGIIDKIEIFSQSTLVKAIAPLEGNEIDLSGLPAGVYLLRIYMGEPVYNRRVVKW
jgi:hypothetical protein